MDDARAGRLLRVLRRRARLTQKALGAIVGMSQQEISLLERGHVDVVQTRTIRAVFRGVGASADWDIRWRGGAIDRLLDERHAALAGAVTQLLTGLGWQVIPELTYNEFGDRGAIDLVAWHAATSTLLIVEIKTELTSIEQTCRKHDEKVRLGPKLCRDRFGWRPRTVARLLVLPDHRTARRQVERADAILGSIYPTRGWATRRWLGEPSGRGDGLIFVGPSSRARTARGSRAPSESAGR